ncbi:hypothetical protein SEVIR_2G339701v4 [Setaria viridis]|uniref:Uncharacterized protein n=1 Tax=Setaria viridis TaxID=4556 RepID=A0A4U6VY54_SETVI|nr:hypothetical protein SEVIR_2G339701v2 [Setaria viridis]
MAAMARNSVVLLLVLAGVVVQLCSLTPPVAAAGRKLAEQQVDSGSVREAQVLDAGSAVNREAQGLVRIIAGGFQDLNDPGLAGTLTGPKGKVSTAPGAAASTTRN